MVNGGYCNDAGDAITLYCQTTSGQRTPFNIYVPFLYKPEEGSLDVWYDETYFIGHTFNLTGIYTFHKSTSGNISYQIVPRDSNDLVLVA